MRGGSVGGCCEQTWLSGRVSTRPVSGLGDTGTLPPSPPGTRYRRPRPMSHISGMVPQQHRAAGAFEEARATRLERLTPVRRRDATPTAAVHPRSRVGDQRHGLGATVVAHVAD